MRFLQTALSALTIVTLSAGPAHALTLDAKKLARYDASYQRCEALYPEMKGQRDVAYLRLYHAPEDEKTLAKLAAVRRSSVYRAEQSRLKKAPAPAASAASGPLAQQCQGLWGEAQRARK